MDIDGLYKIIITPTAYREMYKTYNYISKNLKAPKASQNLMEEIENSICNLQSTPKMYVQLKKVDELNRIYRRIVIKNFVVLYTIDEENKNVYIAHVYYGGRNYIDDLL